MPREGSPTVVLMSGYRASGRYWTDDLRHPDDAAADGAARGGRVHPRLYLRPPRNRRHIGEDDLISRSDAIAQPRTTPDAVAELHALLQAAADPRPLRPGGPLVGGFIARLYAATYPDEVIGLVLVDAYSERLESLMPPERWAALVRLDQEMGTDEVFAIEGYGDPRRSATARTTR